MLYDSIIKNQIDLERFSEGIRQRVVRILEQAQAEIVGKLVAIDPTEPVITKWKKERLQKLNQQISDILDIGYDHIQEKVVPLQDLAKVISENTPKMFNAELGINLFDVTLTEELLKSIVENTMIDGKIIGEWWDNQKEAAKERTFQTIKLVTEEIEKGIVKGEALTEIVNRIRGKSINEALKEGTAAKDGIMAVSKAHATTLVRTSIMQVTQHVRYEIYKANEDILKGYQWLSTLDTRTTPLCKSLDLKEYDLNFQPVGHSQPFPGIPAHWNCRSTLCPLTKDYDELMHTTLPKRKKKQLRNASEGTRASLNGQVPASMDYSEWLKTQSEEIQIESLGKGRWDLWKTGKLRMEDMIHQNKRPLTLEQLKERMLK